MPHQVHTRLTSIAPILLVNFIGTLGYSIVLPFLVVLVLRMGGNEITYGFLGATYSFFQLIGAPVLGNWSDRAGRKKVLLLSQAGTFLGWCIFLVALLLPETYFNHKVTAMFSLPLLLVFTGRAIDGLTGGNVSVANAYLADISRKEERKKNFGRMSAAANLGLVFGPALAGILSGTALGYTLPVLAAILVSLAAIIFIAFRLKEIRPADIRAPLNGKDFHKLLGQEHKDCYKMQERESLSFIKLIGLPNILLMLILYFLIFLAFNFYYVAFPVYVAGKLKWDTLQIGIFFSILSGALVLVQGPVLSFLSARFSGAALVIAGSIILAFAFSLFRYPDLIRIYSGLALFALGNGIMWPSFLAILSGVADDRYQGTIQGLAGSAGSLASIIGLMSGAFIYRFAGVNTFLLAGALMLIIAAAAIRLKRIEKEAKPPSKNMKSQD